MKYDPLDAMAKGLPIPPPCTDYAPDTLHPEADDRDICTTCFYRGDDHDNTVHREYRLTIRGVADEADLFNGVSVLMHKLENKGTLGINSDSADWVWEIVNKETGEPLDMLP